MALAYRQSGQIDLDLLVWVLTGGLAAHGAVNVLNEYLDFKSGLDLINPVA